jgi:hypothetical protein
MPVYSLLKQWGPVKNGVARITNLILVVSGLVACGCSSADRGGKVTGSVQLDVKPLADAHLSFIKKGEAAATNVAVTDAEGNFQVKPDKAKRTLPPGTYTVLVRKYVQKDGKPPPPAEDQLMLIASGQLHNILPERYSSPKSSPLTVEIKPGDNALPPLELKSR